MAECQAIKVKAGKEAEQSLDKAEIRSSCRGGEQYPKQSWMTITSANARDAGPRTAEQDVRTSRAQN